MRLWDLMQDSGRLCISTLESASRDRTGAIFCSALSSAAWGTAALQVQMEGPVQGCHPTNKHVLHVREPSHAGLELIGISKPHRS